MDTLNDRKCLRHRTKCSTVIRQSENKRQTLSPLSLNLQNPPLVDPNLTHKIGDFAGTQKDEIYRVNFQGGKGVFTHKVRDFAGAQVGNPKQQLLILRAEKEFNFRLDLSDNRQAFGFCPRSPFQEFEKIKSSNLLIFSKMLWCYPNINDRKWLSHKIF